MIAVARPTLPEEKRLSRVVAVRFTKLELDALMGHVESQQLRRSAARKRITCGSVIRSIVLRRLRKVSKFARAKLRD
jgi:hypothetical protein